MNALSRLLAAVSAISLPIVLVAEQASDNIGLGLSYSVNVDLDFEINVPELLIFRVGSPDNAVDEVVFNVGQNPPPPTADQSYSGQPLYGDSVPVSATSNGSLEVEVIANSGVAIISTSFDNSAGLSNNNGNFIPFDEIAVESDNAELPAPQLTNTGTAPVTVTANRHGGLVTEQVSNWTYSYKNSEAVAAGQYIGVVTYTASVP